MTGQPARQPAGPSSGKTARDENFPVGSWLIAAPLRLHVANFYTFARAADDVADARGLPAAEKLRLLDRFEAGLDAAADAPDCARRLRESLDACGVSDAHARDLLAAFRRDAANPRCADWEDLLGYCALSAHPVGRFLLDLHGESPAQAPEAYAASDALCAALQVLNHLQDIAPDCHGLDRIYLPQNWLAVERVAEADLVAPSASPGLRRVIDRALDGCDALLVRAAALPGRLRSRRLAAESAAILALARRLAAGLRRGDPLARRVALSRKDFVWAMLCGLVVFAAPRSRPPARQERVA
ncbi:MAG: squalene synthase HpnC [Alphaproteobacteria bacterium HGW-Alphaproteobacteria-2]|nr:MAG: squalene synthase HpnC [Alphaproteobacteria bacterium HGW-Alphaproteobacteria-2]